MVTYHPKGVCSRKITFDIDEDGRLRDVHFEGGCNGNTKGLASLCEGMLAEEVVSRLKGIRCGLRYSSCPDQLATAIEQELKK